MAVEIIPTEKEINYPPPGIDPVEEVVSEQSSSVPEESRPADAAEHTPESDSSTATVSASEREAPVAQPTPKPKGRPKGSKNKTPKKTVVLEPVQEPLSPVREEVQQEPPPLSPRSRRRERMQALAEQRREQQKTRVAYYTALLDKSMGY